MSKQVDASPEAQQLAAEKTQRKLFLRNEFLKLKTDPFQHAASDGGAVFDSAFLRYQAMQASYYDFFKPTRKPILYGIFCMVLPMFGFGFLVNNSRNKKEAAYRRGEVAYKDRDFKFA